MSDDEDLLDEDLALDALYEGDIETFISYIENDPTLLDEMPSGSTWLHQAAREGALAFAEYLVKKGADIDAVDVFLNRTPLEDAALHGHIDVVRLLMAKGAQVDMNKSGNPVLSSIFAGNVEMLKLFLSSGLDVHKIYEGPNGRFNALSYAIERGQEQIAKLLRAHGCQALSK